MSLSSTNNKDIYLCDGTTRNWPITFPVDGLSDTDITVYLTDENGISSEITNGVEIDLNTPKVIYPTVASGLAIPDSPIQVVVARIIPLKQEFIDVENQGAIPLSSIESSFDRVFMGLQQLDEKVNRTAVADISEESFDSQEYLESLANAVTAAQLAETNAETAETNAETAETNAEIAQAAAEAARDEATLAVASLGFTLDTSTDLDGASASDIKVPSQLAVKTYADTKLASSALDTSTDLDGVSASDSKVPSQLAVKTYVDSVASDEISMGEFVATGEEMKNNIKPFSHYKLNESAANQDVADSGSGSHTGTSFRNTSLLSSAGKISNSFLFASGSGDYVSVPDIATDLASDTYGSILCFIKTTHTGSYIFSFFKNTTDNSLGLNLSGTGKLNASCEAGGVAKWEVTGSITVNDGNWHYVAVVHNGTEAKMYVDGVLDSGATFSTSVDKTVWISGLGGANLFKFGSRADGAGNYTGNIDDFRIYRTALTAVHIAILYNNGAGTELFSG